MGCFLGCFGGAKERRRRRRKRSPAQSPNGRARAVPRVTPKKVDLDGEAVSAAAPLLATLLELRDSTDDMCLAVVKKKVTFDPNVTTFEAAPIPEDDGEEADPEDGGDCRDCSEKGWMLAPECAKSEAFPLNHRYNNCAGKDSDSDYEDAEEDEYDEFEDDEEEEEEEEWEDGIDECAIDDDEDVHGLLGIGRSEEDACESLFLLPFGKTSKDSGGQVAAPVVPPAKAPAVLSSVENLSLTWWKEPKPRAAAAPKSPQTRRTSSLWGRRTGWTSSPSHRRPRGRRRGQRSRTTATPPARRASRRHRWTPASPRGSVPRGRPRATRSGPTRRSAGRSGRSLGPSPWRTSRYRRPTQRRGGPGPRVRARTTCRSWGRWGLTGTAVPRRLIQSQEGGL